MRKTVALGGGGSNPGRGAFFFDLLKKLSHPQGIEPPPSRAAILRADHSATTPYGIVREYFVDTRLRKISQTRVCEKFWCEGIQRCEMGFFDESSHNQPVK